MENIFYVENKGKLFFPSIYKKKKVISKNTFLRIHFPLV